MDTLATGIRATDRAATIKIQDYFGADGDR